MDIIDINTFKPRREGNDSQFVSKESYCTHICKNPGGKFVRQFVVDGEVFPKGKPPQRCDYLILNDTDRTAYYIELKGSDIPVAIAQIDSTRSLISHSIKDYTYCCRIILHKVRSHQINDDFVIRWKRKHHAIIIQGQYMDIL